MSSSDSAIAFALNYSQGWAQAGWLAGSATAVTFATAAIDRNGSKAMAVADANAKAGSKSAKLSRLAYAEMGKYGYAEAGPVGASRLKVNFGGVLEQSQGATVQSQSAPKFGTRAIAYDANGTSFARVSLGSATASSVASLAKSSTWSAPAKSARHAAEVAVATYAQATRHDAIAHAGAHALAKKWDGHSKVKAYANSYSLAKVTLIDHPTPPGTSVTIKVLNKFNSQVASCAWDRVSSRLYCDQKPAPIVASY
jgi:hypothetical protein